MWTQQAPARDWASDASPDELPPELNTDEGPGRDQERRRGLRQCYVTYSIEHRGTVTEHLCGAIVERSIDGTQETHGSVVTSEVENVLLPLRSHGLPDGDQVRLHITHDVAPVDAIVHGAELRWRERQAVDWAPR